MNSIFLWVIKSLITIIGNEAHLIKNKIDKKTQKQLREKLPNICPKNQGN
ncbi:hypothetical protein SAMN05421777_10792 [Fluoribacter gormanii]|uniref:Uncharacterized protein n=1 Tax=Fluoribacter gormanii TaxID=464 RepID=A0A377GNM3_9GAMM|nr:hypothetical protein SAMN05421777_10792 [Fluoribacter gormanii]STO26224.1 Uncharacterised protein [Fluoribacter gormanii]